MYNHVLVGGTFDGLHKGHKYLLSQAFLAGKEVTIGLTSEAYIRRFKKDRLVTPYNQRHDTLTVWLTTEGYLSRSTIVPLDNAYGPALLGTYDAIVVTKDNKHTALDINFVRNERGLKPLALIEVPLVVAQDARPISSTRMRNGEIDANGHLKMPEKLKPQLQQPLGRLLAESDISTIFAKGEGKILITVGDVTTKKFLDHGIHPTLAVIDLFAQRHPFLPLSSFGFSSKSSFTYIRSGPGYISKQALDTLSTLLSHITAGGIAPCQVVVVDGEEDLLTLPVIAQAPVGSMIYYGQPPIASGGTSPVQEGLVEVAVTKEKQDEANVLLEQFVRTTNQTNK